MIKLLRWVGVVLFLSLPAIAIYGIMQGDIRYLFIFGTVAFFSILSIGFADAFKEADKSRGTLF